MKKLPIGIDNFKKLREGNYYFFDKSMLIDELLENKSEVTLLPRPRRFGKTLNMSMISYFFDVNNKDENRKLFEGLAIEKTRKMEFQGQYPVIYISLKDIKNNTWEAALKSLKELIKRTYEEYELKIDSEDFYYETSLLNLSKLLYEKFNKKVIILIDEYDTPLISAYTGKFYEEAISFLRNFYSSVLKGNPYLEMAVMTGILRLAKESIFSGLNNLLVSTIISKDYPYFGIKETEVVESLKEYKLSYEIDEVKKWYNGYRFGDEYFYNPWSVINFLRQKELEPYWVNTSENSLIKEMLDTGDKNLLEDLEKLFTGNVTEKYIVDNMLFSDLDKPNNFWSLMLYSGYLTYESKKIDEFIYEPLYSLKIPNYEVKSFFRRSFIEINSSGDSSLYSKMLRELYLGNVDIFSRIFKEMYRNAVSYHDSSNDEKYYHHFMLGLLLVLGERYVVTSNRESGLGRYDIALEPINKNDYGLIFEFKVGNKENLLEKSLEALAQIENKEYDMRMKFHGVSKIIKISMAFSGKEVEISSSLTNSLQIKNN